MHTNSFKILTKCLSLFLNNINVKYYNSSQIYLMSKKTYCHYKYHSKVEAMINKQIQTEQQVSQDYLSIAVSFLHPCQAYPGAAGFFMRMHEEEIGHMQNFIQYQLLRGGRPIISGISVPNIPEELTLLNAFQTALIIEKNVTELLENLVATAESVKDHQCADYVTTEFLAEQAKSLHEISHHIAKLTRLTDDQHAMYQYDKQLLAVYPYLNKKFKFIV